MVDRALSCVSAPVRLVGMFLCVLCVCLTQSPLYLMLMAAIALVLVAVRPVRGLWATFVPALGAAGLAVVLALPALLLGAPRPAPTRSPPSTSGTASFASGTRTERKRTSPPGAPEPKRKKGRGRPSTRPRARLHPGEPAQAGSPGAGHSFASHDAEPPRAHIAPRPQAS